MMGKNIERRIEKIEKKLAVEDKTEWLRWPDPDSPDGFVEIKGCRTIADFLINLYET